LRRLLDAGVVQKCGQIPSAGGRRPDDLKLNPDAGYFAVIDLEGPRVRFGLASLDGDIRHRWEEPFRDTEPLTMKTFAKGLGGVACHLSAEQRRRIVALGVSYSGLLNRNRMVTAINIPGWEAYPLERNLRSVTDLPIFLGTEALTKLSAERWRGAARGLRNVIYVTVANGVGIALLVDGHIVTGRDGFAGELGHTRMDGAARRRCNCGKTGCLEAVASGPSIVRQYAAASRRGGERLRWDQVSEVFERARAGDRVAQTVTRRAAAHLGVALANLANVLNPELIVLGGDALLGEDVWLPVIRERVQALTLPEIGAGLELRCTELGPDNGLIGAASLAFHGAIHDPTLLERIS
jgi:glucokinase